MLEEEERAVYIGADVENYSFTSCLKRKEEFVYTGADVNNYFFTACSKRKKELFTLALM